ncbi:protein FAM151B-like [Daphnia pulicaria]|uniref:protein FAM151B-like n=1 Tax=Daphnia pulicaria TaxID=35523 RepID=UPI001EECE7C6|nr:protein FAM151B-like [Daphnia pulicaria]
MPYSRMSRYQCSSVTFICLPSMLSIKAVGWTMILLFITQVKSASYIHGNDGVTIPSVAKFFPQIQSDLSRVKWGHGVNSKAQLSQTLQGTDMMIEADVSMGIVTGREGKFLPIMAHPPFKSSDLSLEEFLDTTLSSRTPKGIKLDFKDMEAVELSLRTIKTRANKIYAPLWLNADIIQGPVNATTKPLDARRFLNLTKSYFPDAVLSVGWTTRYGPDVSSWPLQIINEGSYTMNHMIQLRDALRAAQIRQPVTFPIRAGLCTTPESQRSIIWLLEQVEDSTLTIWSGPFDTVDVPGLMKLIKHVGTKRIYIDVSSGLLCEIQHFNDRY